MILSVGPWLSTLGWKSDESQPWVLASYSNEYCVLAGNCAKIVLYNVEVMGVD